MQISASPIPALTSDQQQLLEDVAAPWRQPGGQWPRSVDLEVDYDDVNKNFRRIRESMPHGLCVIMGQGHQERTHLTMAGVGLTRDGARDVELCLALIRRGVERYIEHPYERENAKFTSGDLAEMSGVTAEEKRRVPQVFLHEWLVRDRDDGWECETSMQKLAFKGVATLADYWARKNRGNRDSESDDHRAVAAAAYEHWHRHRVWPVVTELLLSLHERFPDVYHLLCELPYSLREDFGLNGGPEERFALKLDGIMWAAPQSEEVALFFKIVDVLQRAYRSSRPETVAVESVARELASAA